MAQSQINDALQAGFMDAIGKRAEAKRMSEAAAALVEEANAVIEVFFAVTGMAEGVAAGIGKVKVVESIRKSTDKALFRELLVRAGLTADKVVAAETAATSESHTRSISFYPEKAKV